LETPAENDVFWLVLCYDENGDGQSFESSSHARRKGELFFEDEGCSSNSSKPGGLRKLISAIPPKGNRKLLGGISHESGK
jgi:hypothetical protein